MSGLRSQDVFSHPGILLIDHLSAVAHIGLNLHAKYPINFSGINKQKFEDIIFITLFSHDSGKATSYFQKYLASAGKESRGEFKNHAHISALICYFFVDAYLKYNNESLNEIITQLLPAISFQCILRHHGALADISSDYMPVDGKKARLKAQYIDMFQYLKHIHQKMIDRIPTLPPPPAFEALWSSVFNLYSLDFIYEESEDAHFTLETYLMQLYLFSLLVDSDKSHAIFKTDLNTECTLSAIPQPIVRDYINQFISNEQKPINEIRERIYNVVDNQTRELSIDSHILNLKLPTGCGKTLVSLNAALILARRICDERKTYPRIVYCLPFTSIIDQNFMVYDEVFKEFSNNNDFILVKHHHLCDFSNENSNNHDDEDESLDFLSHYKINKQFFVEGWNANIIVTTLYQLLHSIFDNHNKPLRKIHRYAGSIFLIDEVQAIKHEHFSLIHELFSVLAVHFNCYFIFISATQPPIFSKDESVSLFPDEDRLYHQGFKSRVNIHNQLDSAVKSIEDLYEWSSSNVKSNSILFILNTISSAKKLCHLFGNHLDTGVTLHYLSSHITPKERLNRIHQIHTDLKKKKPTILVSTQIVEAGVDIDFDMTVRDFAPWDSIMQAAGRCNRHGTMKEPGNMYLFELAGERGTFAKKIYDPTLLNITREILKDYDIIPEEMFFSISNKYYEKIQKKTSQSRGDAILKCMRSLQYKRVNEQFQLIDIGYSRQDIFVPIEPEAIEIWERYERLFEDITLSNFERKEKFSSFKSLFLSYVISVPCSTLGWYAGEHKPIILLPTELLDEYYDSLNGYIPKSTQLDLIF